MSEKNEQVPIKNEVKPTETSNEQLSQTKEKLELNYQEVSMLEDEEMPTYISVSSLSKCEDSEIGNAQQNIHDVVEDYNASPCPSPDQGEGSIYIVSSGNQSESSQFDDEDEDEDDEEEEEDEEEYADSDDYMDMEQRNYVNSEGRNFTDMEQRNFIDIEQRNISDEEDIEPDYVDKYFDRQSDDFDMRKRPLQIKYQIKEKSLSLQDLSSYDNLNLKSKMDSTNSSKDNYSSRCSIPNRRRTSYDGVHSRVRSYIREMKKQSKLSRERRSQERQFIINQGSNLAVSQSELVISSPPKVQKGFTGSLNYTKAHLMKNGQPNNIAEDTTECHKSENDPMEIEYNEVAESQNCNGMIELDMRNNQHQITLTKNSKFENKKDTPIINGHDGQMPLIFSTVTLTQEEFMQGSKNSSHKLFNVELQQVEQLKNGIPIENDNLKKNVGNSELQYDSDNMQYSIKNQRQEKLHLENEEISSLKSQLKEKTNQYNNLHEIYQKTLTEKLKMEKELEEMKKKLLKYEKETSQSETKNIEKIETKSHIKQENVAPDKTCLKVSGTSIESTNSNEQWAESTCSVAISIKTPDITSISSIDSSIVDSENNQKKDVRPLSRTLITSSRILQTLSNLTQRKGSTPNTHSNPLLDRKLLHELQTKLENPTTSVNNEQIQNSSGSKKRKATEMLHSSPGCSQPFKIPHTMKEDERIKMDNSGKLFENTLNTCKSDNPPNISQDEEMESESQENILEADDSITCHFYPGDENNKNSSFFIRATDDSLKYDQETGKGRVRQCGPYLLGNLEVRMAEINGTLSIWGKEISQDSTVDIENELGTSKKLKSKSCHCCHTTTNAQFSNSHSTCSKFKKSKVSPRCQSANSSILSTLRSQLAKDNNVKHSSNQAFKKNENSSQNHFCDTNDCQKTWSSTNAAETSSCCINHTEYLDLCNSEKYHKHIPSCSSAFKDHCASNKGHRKFSFKNTFNCMKNLNKRSSFNRNSSDESHSKNCHCCLQDTEDSEKTPPICEEYLLGRTNDLSEKCANCRSYETEDDPLLSMPNSTETPEVNQRKLTGRRVRNIIMDLLRSCGDCHNCSAQHGTEFRTFNPNTSNKNTNLQDDMSTPNFVPQTRVTPCTSGCTQHHSKADERCCHAYAQRVETQLEEFRIGMERVLLRSDAILNMLNLLQSADDNK